MYSVLCSWGHMLAFRDLWVCRIAHFSIEAVQHWVFNCAVAENSDLLLPRVLLAEGSEILWQLLAGSAMAVFAITDGAWGTQVCLLVLNSVTEICGDLQIMLVLENYRWRRKHTWKRCCSTPEENSLVVGPEVQDPFQRLWCKSACWAQEL